MKTLFLSILILLFIYPLVSAEPNTDYFPLAEGNYWVYEDQIEIQDPQGNFEVENKYIGEKVKVKRINQLRTLKVLSTETRGDFKIAKMQEEGTPEGIITFFYVVDNKNGRIYSYSNEQIKMILPNNNNVTIKGSPEYIFPLQVGSKWGDPESLERKDRMYFSYVESLEDITAPAGTFKGCFKIIHYTLPDETTQWFCPNVGIVRLEYRHHGTIDNLVSELKETSFASNLIISKKSQYPLPKLELEGDKIILKQDNKTYIYPSDNKDRYGGIKKVLQEDVDGDGKNEYILVAELEGLYDMPFYPYAVVLICEREKDILDVRYNSILGHISPDFEIIDVDRDGVKDIVATAIEPMHWKHLKIISWKKGEYILLWNKGEDDFAVEQSLVIDEKGNVQIKVGYPLHPEGGYGYAPELWEIWTWDGDKFVCTQGETKEKPIR